MKDSKGKELVKYITTAEALTMAGLRGIAVTRPTLLKWAKRYKFGHQLGDGKFSKWVYDKEKWEAFLDGKR